MKAINSSSMIYLGEMKNIILRLSFLFLVSFLIFWNFQSEIMEKLVPSFSTLRHNFIVADLMDNFWIPFKLSFYVSLYVIIPSLLFELYFFISPALKVLERKQLKFIFLVGTILFYLGSTLWFSYLLPMSTKYLVEINTLSFQGAFNLNNFLSFSFSTGLIFGLIFFSPLILLALINLRIIPVELIKSKRRHIYFGCALMSGILTPSPDAFTMLMLFIPFIILVEIVIFVSQVSLKNNSNIQEEK